MNKLDRQVEERQWQQTFEELAGRATPPDRTHEILRRAMAREVPAGSQPGAAATATGTGSARIWAAALLLLGLTVTVVAAVLERGDDGRQPQPAGGPDALAQIDVMVPQEPAPSQDPQTVPNAKSQTTPTTAQGAGPKPPNKTDKQLPKGTDPADLAAMRSANEMLEAEKKLAQRIKDGKIVGIDKVLPFSELNDWKYSDGLRDMPQRIRKLDGQKVLMLGFMLPLDEVEGMREFLLVSSLWSCCYGTPPNIHGIVRCRMPTDKNVDYQFKPIKVVGTFDIEATVDDGYCVDIYQLHVELLEVIE